MKKNCQSNFVITNKKKGLCLYDSFRGPTNISKSEAIARARDKEVYGDNYGIKSTNFTGKSVNQQVKSTSINSDGWQILCESRHPDVNLPNRGPDSMNFEVIRYEDIQEEVCSKSTAKVSKSKKKNFQFEGNRQIKMSSRTNDSFFESEESVLPENGPNVTRRSKRYKQVILKFNSGNYDVSNFIFQSGELSHGTS